MTVLETGDADGTGKVVKAETKGFLPYVLHWCFRVTRSVRRKEMALEAWGDLEGRGRWTFASRGAATYVTYEWIVKAEKPLLKYFSFVLRPLFAANHNYVMRKGEAGLRKELERRRKTNKFGD